MSDWIPNNVDLFVARQIRQIRKKDKITISNMARYLNISEKKLKQIEQAISPLSVGLLFQIVSVLGCDFQDLFPELVTFQDSIQVRHKKITDFCTFAEELIHNYLVHGSDESGCFPVKISKRPKI